MVASTRSIVLERRPDLPLYGLRTVRHLRAGKSNNHDVRLLLSSSAGRLQETRDTHSLLQTPTKVCSSQGMPRRDRIAIGKAIVDRPRRDDHWVTTDTAPLSFAATTKELPVNSKNFKHPLNRGDRAAMETTPGKGVRREGSRQAHAKVVSGLIGTRELALLESYYRLAAAECRTENPPRASTADPGGDRRYRRPKANNEEGCSTDRPSPCELNDEINCTTASFSEGFDEGVSVHGGVSKSGQAEYRDREVGTTTRLRQAPNTGMPKSSRPCLSSRSPLRGRATTSPNASRPQKKVSRDLFNSISQSRAAAEDAGDTRAGWSAPTMLYVGRSGVSGRGNAGGEEEDCAGGTGQGSQNVALHRGLVITEELRKEILNPLAHRFKLLRRGN